MSFATCVFPPDLARNELVNAPERKQLIRLTKCVKTLLHSHLSLGWLFGWLAGFLVGYLGWWVGRWVGGWLPFLLVSWLAGWLAVCL